MISFIAFSLRRAWQGFWRNGVMSLAATATMILMLLLLAGFWVIQTGLTAGLEFVEQKVQVVAELKEPVAQFRVDDLRLRVSQLPEVASVEYVTKEEAIARFREREKQKGHEDLTQYLDTNPLPASLQVTLRDPNIYGNVVDFLKAEAIVAKVDPVESYVNRLLTVTTILRTAGVVILGLVGLTVLFIIINTIRLAVVARSEEIEIMRLVGASDAFVRWPFIFEGALVGGIGAAVTLVLFALAADPLSGVMTSFFEVLPLQLGSLVRDVVVLTVGAGLGLGSLGAWLSVRSYLAR
ncbi:MAG TPA: permease-like cell division protein FtsX [Candidatus Limnocylindria bacterium]|nr:permease-like cell division protein FtsX [Candidatus Limnocylindria bacterium]